MSKILMIIKTKLEIIKVILTKYTPNTSILKLAYSLLSYLLISIFILRKTFKYSMTYNYVYTNNLNIIILKIMLQLTYHLV
jgi:hypothetical protein